MTAITVDTFAIHSAHTDIKYINKVNKRTLHSILNGMDWSQCTQKDFSVDDIYNSLKSNFDSANEQASQSVKYNHKTYKNKWITNGIISSMKCRDNIKLKLSKDPYNPSLRLEFNVQRNKVNRQINKAKNSFYKQKIIDAAGSTWLIWREMNTVLGKRVTNIDEDLLKKFNIKPKLIAQNFSNSFKAEIDKIKISCDTKLFTRPSVLRMSDKSIYLRKATDRDIDQIIKNSNKKSAGVDGIKMEDVQSLREKLTPIITVLINQSIKQCIVPDLLKTAIIRPIYKKGSDKDYENYRPISILSSINKITEKFICDQIKTFLKNNNIISRHQFGFQEGKGTTALIKKFTNSLNNKLNKGFHIVSIFIDFSRAFDTINHNLLNKSLEEVHCSIGYKIISVTEK
jgi:hypothetical protein